MEGNKKKKICDFCDFRVKLKGRDDENENL